MILCKPFIVSINHYSFVNKIILKLLQDYYNNNKQNKIKNQIFFEL